VARHLQGLVAEGARMTRDEFDRKISAAIRDKADYHRAPPSLVSDVMSSLPAQVEEPQRPRWQFWLAQGAAMAGVALVTWAATMGYLRPGDDERRADEILASHVGATL